MNGANGFQKSAAALLPAPPGPGSVPDHSHGGRPLREVLRDCERQCIHEALRIHEPPGVIPTTHACPRSFRPRT